MIRQKRQRVKTLQADKAGRRPFLTWHHRLTRLLVRHKGIPIGGTLLIMVLGMALLAPWLTRMDPMALHPRDRLLPPGHMHLFGTDNFGRDIFSRTVWGARLSLAIGCLVALLTTLSGTCVGLTAGYFRRLDTPVMRVMDGMMAFPGILLAIALMSALGPSTFNVVTALTVVYTPQGMSHQRILLRHIFPSCLSPLMVQTTFLFAEAVLGEASLSFLGAGIPPYIPSWGNMLGEARAYLRDAPWTMVFPGLSLTVTVLALNVLGDGLRDVLDPRLRKG